MMTLEKFYENFKEEHKGDAHSLSWLNGFREDWMSDEQWLCALFLNRLFKGFHHIHAPFREYGKGLCINTSHAYFSTVDYDTLTKAVIMAHNWGVRMEILGSGPGMIKIALWKRYKREGRIAERHPTIEEAIEKYKDY